MSTNRDELRELLAQMPEGVASEVLDFAHHFVMVRRGLAGEHPAPTEEDRAWLAAGLDGLGDRLARIEAEVPAEDLAVWKAAFEKERQAMRVRPR